MKLRRSTLVGILFFATLAGCHASPVAMDSSELVPPRFDAGGQTLGSGHRAAPDATTATDTEESVAADSSTTLVGGQTLGSGH